MNINGNRIFTILALIIVLAIGAVLGNYLPSKMKVTEPLPTETPSVSEKSYSVVYLTTGEIYIGRLTLLPKMELNDAYLLQTVKDKTDATKSSIQLTPLKEALWAPKQLFLNEENVIFYGPIEEGSKAAEAIRNAGK